ncbi:MAG TPA: hypothetical protein VKB14_00275 [Actinomycetales bacterium]|nr:hypothetical protein [Actinomycetales bacterium]
MTAVFGPTDSDRTRPNPAELARTAIASACVGCLTTYPRSRPAQPHHTRVVLEPDVEGRPVVRLAFGSQAAAQVLARALATLRVGVPGTSAVLVHGSMQRLAAERGQLRYQVEVVAVRVASPHWQRVPLTDYRAADPDPLRREAPGVLDHLARHHGPQLTACLRALGHDTQWVEPRSLDCRGLDVLSVDADGVELVRLAFPRPVTQLRDLSTGLAAPLLCRCHRDGATDGSG